MPYTQEYLELEQAMGGRARGVLQGSPEEIRAMTSASAAYFASLRANESSSVSSTDDQHGGIKFRIYRPQHSGGLLPLCVWAHGGGLMIGDLDTDDHLCRVVAEGVSCVVVSVDYRLSPENKVPTHLEDVRNICLWALQNANAIGADPDKLMLGGVSAGAALALQVAKDLAADSSKPSPVKGVVSLCPFTVHPANIPERYSKLHHSYQDNEVDVPFINKASMENFFHHAGAAPDDARTFVALAPVETFEQFPATVLFSCEYDPLRDDSFVMEHILRAAGTHVRHEHYSGLPHCFWVFPSLSETDKLEKNLVGQIQWLVQTMQKAS